MINSDPYFINYQHLPSKTLRAMLCYENHIAADPQRFSAIRHLLSMGRTVKFRINRRTYVEKAL